MDEETLKSYMAAGEISKKAKKFSKKIVRPGANLFEVGNSIEEKIRELGGELAFPINLCLNDVTAHYTPKWQDETIIQDSDVISVDMGVHINGYIADTAYTLDFSGECGKLLEANQEALDSVISMVRPGVSVSALGETVQTTLAKYGYKPIENLTGHQVEQYDLHAGISIPNIPVPFDKKIEEGMMLAIEPFATDGYGRVIEARHAEIFSLLEKKPVRMPEARTVIKEVEIREKLPFAERWFSDKIAPVRLSLALRDMVARDILKAYPVLHEKEKGIVSQFEHTLAVTANGCEVTT